MNLSKWNLLLFAAIGVVGMLVLMAIPLPDAGPAGVDSKTGERIGTAWDRLADARRFGEVRLALVRLGDLEESDAELVAAARKTLEDELADPPKPSRQHKQRLLAATLERAELMELLQEVAQDRRIAQATEQFFSPFNLAELPDNNKIGPDGIARFLAARRKLGESVAAPGYLDTASRFQQVARPRACLRWLLRGWNEHPDDLQIRDALVGFYLRHGRTAEAYAVQRHILPGDENSEEYWARRAELARWNAQPRHEAVALERLIAFGESSKSRERLLQLWPSVGQPERALPHAEHLATTNPGVAARERAIQLAFRSGNPSRGLRMLENLAKSSANPVPYHRRAAKLAAQNFDFDRAIRNLERALKHRHSDTIEADLEKLIRRRDLPAKLADLLERRLQRQPDDTDLQDQLMAICVGLGQRDRALRILAGHGKRPSAHRFFLNLPSLAAAGLPGLALLAKERTTFADVSQDNLGEIFEALRPLLDQSAFREVATTLLQRFPTAPKSRGFSLAVADSHPNPIVQAAAVGALARDQRTDIGMAQAWADRASWTNQPQPEIIARRHLAGLQPGNTENLARLAQLYDQIGAAEQATAIWSTLPDRVDPRSPAAERLVDALLRRQRTNKALQLLTARADHPAATTADHLAVAEALFSHQFSDRAKPWYQAVLAEEQDHPVALLRLGQIHSWSNDPAGAIPYLERRAKIVDQQTAQVQFYLGEAYYSVQRAKDAEPLHREALAALRERAKPSFTSRSMMARILVRLHNADEAWPIYKKLIWEKPGNIDLALDYAESLMNQGSWEQARSEVDRAMLVDAKHQRLLRVHGQLLVHEQRFDAAADRFEESIERYGPEAGVLSDLGRAREQQGDWLGAVRAFETWSHLQNDSINAARSRQRLGDRLAETVGLLAHYRWAGDDSASEVQLLGSLILDDQHVRLSAAIGHGSYRGRAVGFRNATEDTDASVTLLDLAAEYRYASADRLALGLTGYAGANGNLPAGIWGSWFLSSADPTYQSLEIRLHSNELWTAPAAAAALGGRSHAVSALAYKELNRHWWLGGDFAAGILELREVAPQTISDGFVDATVSLGYRLIDGDPAIAPPWRVRRNPHSSDAPFLREDPQGERETVVDLRLAMQSFHLLDDAELAGLVPVGKDLDYLMLGANLQTHLCFGLGIGIDGWVGVELSGRGEVWGLEAATTWRATETTEITLRTGVGSSLREQDSGSSSGHVMLQGLVRW